MRKIDYRDYYIAFLDVMGFSNMVLMESAQFIHEIFSGIRMSKKLVTLARVGDVREKTRVYFFSDSIVCAIPASEEKAFESITSNCMLIQHALWERCPVWVRGAIVRGRLYCGNGEVFGPALIDAYRQEEKLARYPRIVMTGETYYFGVKESNGGEDIPYISDTEDGLKMVDTLKYVQGTSEYGPRADIINEMNIMLMTETDPRIREKYLWIRNYCKKCGFICDENKSGV